MTRVTALFGKAWIWSFVAAIAILCIAVGAGAAGALNMALEGETDALMRRTRGRPVAAGRVRKNDAMAFGVVLSLFSVMLLGMNTNWLAAGLLGLTMALAVSLIGIVRGGPEVAMVVAASMVVIVLMGSLIGLSLPFILSRVGVDPATASAPLVTSIADAAGVLIYFGLAYYVFGFAA